MEGPYRIVLENERRTSMEFRWGPPLKLNGTRRAIRELKLKKRIRQTR